MGAFSPPKPQAPVPPPPPPPVADDASVGGAKKRQRAAANNLKNGTLLTGPQGLTDSNPAKKTLLGY